MVKVKKPKIAVLLAAYNGIDWVEEQVESILSQIDVIPVLFISVDLSVDGTDDWVRNKKNDTRSIIMLPYGESFGSAAGNFFRLIRDVDLSGFDAVSFADQDDIWFPDKLSRAWEKISVDRIDAYSSNVIALWRDGSRKIINKAYPQKKIDYFFESAGPGCTYVFSQKSFLFFRDFVIKSYNYLSVIEFHDWLVYAYFRSNNMQWFIDPRPGMYYRQHDNNKIGANSGCNALIKRWRLVHSKWFRQQVLLIAQLVAPHRKEELSSRWFLLCNFYELRRHPRDLLFFLFLILLGVY